MVQAKLITCEVHVVNEFRKVIDFFLKTNWSYGRNVKFLNVKPYDIYGSHCRYRIKTLWLYVYILNAKLFVVARFVEV